MHDHKGIGTDLRRFPCRTSHIHGLCPAIFGNLQIKFHLLAFSKASKPLHINACLQFQSSLRKQWKTVQINHQAGLLYWYRKCNFIVCAIDHPWSSWFLHAADHPSIQRRSAQHGFGYFGNRITEYTEISKEWICLQAKSHLMYEDFTFALIRLYKSKACVTDTLQAEIGESAYCCR